jgi:hypothetical protein
VPVGDTVALEQHHLLEKCRLPEFESLRSSGSGLRGRKPSATNPRVQRDEVVFFVDRCLGACATRWRRLRRSHRPRMVLPAAELWRTGYS